MQWGQGPTDCDTCRAAAAVLRSQRAGIRDRVTTSRRGPRQCSPGEGSGALQDKAPSLFPGPPAHVLVQGWVS